MTPAAGRAGQEVGGRPSRERCGCRRGRDDLAGPSPGRLAPGAHVPPGVLVVRLSPRAVAGRRLGDRQRGR